MFRIGDFARLTRVSVKTLHHYDEIGLFRPSRVDPATGYRYYSFEQLPRLNHILALKGIGFSLEQIARILDASPTLDQLREMLHMRETELDQQIAATQQQLLHLKAYLQLIEEKTMPDIQIVLKPVDSVVVAGTREVVPQAMMRERWFALHQELTQYIHRHGLKTVGPSLALYYDSRPEGIDVEAAYYIEHPTDLPPVEGKVHVQIMPAVPTMATAIYYGSYDEFEAVTNVYRAIGKWIEINGYQINGPSRELYLQTPDWLTSDRIGVMEIQFPVTRP